MRKQVLKYLLILVALAGGTMIFLYAQNGYIFRKPVDAVVEEQKDGQADDIGTLTDDDPWTEMDKLVKAYYNNSGSSFKGSVKLIDDNGEAEKVIEEHPFVYAVLNDNFYYSLDKLEVIQKKDMVLVVDHVNKLVSVSSVEGEQGKKGEFFSIRDFKKLMVEQKATAKVTQLGIEKILTIENIQDPQIQGYRIYYNPQTFRITRMLIGMIRVSPLEDDAAENGIEEIPGGKDDGKAEDVTDQSEEEETIDTYTYYVEINYTEANVLNVTKETFKPESRFITIAGSKMTLAKEFSDYHLIVNSKESGSNKESEKEMKKNSEEE
ncbi:MAG: hypothetical protein ABL876_04920 [Chitinophagaceae bacterium]